MNESSQPIKILSIQLYVIVAGTLYPQWLHGPWRSLKEGKAMREVDDVIVSPMNDQYW